MEKEYLTKNELEKKLISAKKKYIKWGKISNCFTVAGVALVISGGIIALLSSNSIVLGVTGLTLIVGAFGVRLVDKKQESTRKKCEKIKDQLSDIVSMEFEKTRYSLEKKYSDRLNQNDLIKNIIEERELLEKYKQDLNKYYINNIDEELTGEINTRNYTLEKLKQLK